MKFYKVTDSRGRVHTRSTKDRSYSHAIVWHGNQWHGGGASFARTLDLAARQQKPGEEILPTTEISGAEYRAILKGTPR